MKKILVAPLNWGLGHATRCIPIINKLFEQGFTPVLASDGAALELLAQEYPNVERLELPSYGIRYGKNLKASLFRQIPRIGKAVLKERALVDQFVNSDPTVVGIISDNRFGVRSRRVTSVYLTHQLRVLSGLSTFLTTGVHQSFIKKFDECWIPDTPTSTFSGSLSKGKIKGISYRHLGILSRFSPKKQPKRNDLLVILSGPEPNRSQIETKLLEELKAYKGQVCFVRGTNRPIGEKEEIADLRIYDLMGSADLEHEIHRSELILCRSGYSSIMDMAALGKKVFFIPTKGQHEQEYLARYLEQNKYAHFTTEDQFSISDLAHLEPQVKFEITKVKLELPGSDFFKRK